MHGVIPLTITLASAIRNLSATSSTPTRNLAAAAIPTLQAYFLNTLLAQHTSIIFPLGVLVAGTLTINSLKPIHPLPSRLLDYTTPFIAAAASAQKLVRSTSLLEKTIALQEAATKTYQEAIVEEATSHQDALARIFHTE